MCIEEKDSSLKETIAPIRPSYLYVTVAWIQAGQPDKAAIIMEKMHELFMNQQLPYGPCERTFRALIDALRNFPHPRNVLYIEKFQGYIGDLKNEKSTLKPE
jgi:hypothetical protein